MIEAVLYALLCGFALSALLVPLTALAMRRAEELGGATRHVIWFSVLLATAAATCAAFAVSALRPAQQFSGAVVPTAAPTPGDIHAVAAPLMLGVPLLTCWLLVSIAQMCLIVRRIGALRALKHRATPMKVDCELPRGARALASDVNVPSAAGFLHPAILLPFGTIGKLDPTDARRIVLHEAAHLRRGDDLTGLVFLLCAALFWFNPFVHYIGKRLSLEREIACDEIVVELTGDATRYATLLFEMGQSIAGEGPQLAWNGFVHPSGLVVRIQNVLHYRGARHKASACPALAMLIGVLLLSVGLAAFNAPALGRAENEASADANRLVRADSATDDRPAPLGHQRVRDFPICTMGNHSGTRNDPKVCEDPATPSTRSTTRVKNGTVTP